MEFGRARVLQPAEQPRQPVAAGVEVRLVKGPGLRVMREVVQGRSDQPPCRAVRLLGAGDLGQAPVPGSERRGQQSVDGRPIARQQTMLGHSEQHRRRVHTPVSKAAHAAVGFLVVPIDGREFLGRDGVVTAQVVQHVVHVDRLVDRPRRAALVIGKVRVGQVQAHARLIAAVPARQTQCMPQVGAKQIVDDLLGHPELRAASEIALPEPQRGRAGGGVIQSGQGRAGVRLDHRRGQLEDDLLGARGRQVQDQSRGDGLVCGRDVGNRVHALGRKQHAVRRGFLDERGGAEVDDSDRVRQGSLVTETQAHRLSRTVLGRGPHLLQQDQRDIAAPFRRRADQRVRELLDFQTHAGTLESRRQHRQASGQPLAFPLPALQVQLEFELVGIAVIAGHAGPSINAEFWNGAVPCHPHDVTRRDGMRVLIGGAAHVFPTCRVLFIGGVRFSFELVQDPLAGVGLNRGLMLLEREQFVARGEKHVQVWNPQGSFAQQLVDAHRETARPFLIQLHRQQPRIDLEGRIAAQAARRVRVAVREQVVPDGMLGPGLGLGRFLVTQRELDTVHVARPSGGSHNPVGQSVRFLQIPPRRVLKLHSARCRHQPDEPCRSLGRAMPPRQTHAERTQLRTGGRLGAECPGHSRRTREPQGG